MSHPWFSNPQDPDDRPDNRPDDNSSTPLSPEGNAPNADTASSERPERIRGDDRSAGAVEASAIPVTDPDDLVTAIPYLLGFHPSDCLVLVGLSQSCVQVTARLPWEAADNLHAAITQLTAMFSRSSVDLAVVVGYGSEHIDRPLTRFADALSWPVWAVLRVEGERIWSLSCRNPICCPPGAPLRRRDRVRAPLIASCGDPAASREDRAMALRPGPDARLQRVRALLDGQPHQHPGHPRYPLVPSDLLPEWSETVQQASAGGVGDDSAGEFDLDEDDLVAAVAADPEVFDVLVHRCLALERSARRNRRRPVPPGRAALLLHGLRCVHVRDGCALWCDDGAVNLWFDLLAITPAGWAAPVATLLASTAYQRGDGGLATLALDRALDDTPDYTLAHLIARMAAAGFRPEDLTAALHDALRPQP